MFPQGLRTHVRVWARVRSLRDPLRKALDNTHYRTQGIAFPLLIDSRSSSLALDWAEWSRGRFERCRRLLASPTSAIGTGLVGQDSPEWGVKIWLSWRERCEHHVHRDALL